MGFNLGDMFDKITAYEKVQRDFGFVPAGVGERAWSHEFVNADGEVLNVRGSDWVLSCSAGSVIAEGAAPADLKKFLLGRLSHADLLEYASKA